MGKISDKIYNLRKQYEISQEELAFELEVSRQTISKWETGGTIPDTKNLIRLSKYFNVPIETFYTDGEEDFCKEALTKSQLEIDELKSKGCRRKIFFFKLLLIFLIISVMWLISVIVFIGVSICSSSADSGVESVSLVLLNLSLLDVLFICILSLVVMMVFMFIVIFMINKNKQ